MILRLCWIKQRVVPFLDEVVLLYQNIIVDDVITNMCSKEISWFYNLAQMYMHVVS